MRDYLKKKYKKTTSGKWVVYTRRSYKLKFRENEDPGKWFEEVKGPFEQVQSSENTNVATCRALLVGKECVLYFKQYFCRSVSDLLKNLVRPGRAMRSLIGSHFLLQNNLNAPETIAICEKRYGPILVKEYAITLGVSGANDVYWWTNEKSDDRRTFAKALGSEIGRMHKADICHGDLRPGNVLAKQKDNGYEFVFIDNERTVQYKMLPWKFRKKNLVQINMLRPGTIGKKDRIIFFNSYMQHNTRIAAKKRLLATQVASETAERLKQSIKKAVP